MLRPGPAGALGVFVDIRRLELVDCVRDHRIDVADALVQVPRALREGAAAEGHDVLHTPPPRLRVLAATVATR
eukprot:11734196-Alexandrium_andersonii.AAC.1